jgi:ribonuclease HI
MKVGVGARIYREKPKKVLKLSLGKYPTVFQAEVIVIQASVHENLKKEYSAKKILIYTDSQAALKALSCHWTSHLVRDSYRDLVAPAKQNEATLICMPGPKGNPAMKEPTI